MKPLDANDILQQGGDDALLQAFDRAVASSAEKRSTRGGKKSRTKKPPPKSKTAAPEVADRERQGRFLLVRRLGADGRRPGVYHVDTKENDKGERVEEIEWLCSLMEPLAETRDRDNRNWGKQLEVVDSDGVRHIWVMPAKMGPTVGDGVEFRRELVDRGLRTRSTIGES